jgi:hypothetical protein
LLQYYRSRTKEWNENQKEHYDDRYNDEMRYAESTVDMVDLNASFEENVYDDNHEISYDRASHWAQLNNVPGDISQFLNIYAPIPTSDESDTSFAQCVELPSPKRSAKCRDAKTPRNNKCFILNYM